MQQGTAKFAIGMAVALIASFPLSVEAQGLPQSPDAIYFTLSDQAPIDGPVYEPGASGAVSYAGRVARETIIQADRLGAFWLEEENPEAYVSFLMGALVVPLHESSLQHYRRLPRESGRCAEALNSGTLASSAGAKAERIFDSVMKSGAAPIVPACSSFRSGDPALQLLGSYDGLSTGLMQINFVAHPDYLPHGDFLSVRKTVARGLEQYFGGFKKLVENPARYACVRGSAPGDINYSAVIRGAWSGAYNSGSVTQSCRFTALSRPDSTEREQKWARENDAPFKRDFDAALDLRSGLYAVALNGDEAQLHRDIVGAYEALEHGADLASLTAQARAIRAEIARAAGAPAPAPRPQPVATPAPVVTPPVAAPPAVGPARPQPVTPTQPARPAAVTGAISIVHSFFPGAPAPAPVAEGTIKLAPGGSLNVRLRPSTEARIVDVRKGGAHVSIYARFHAKGDPVGWVAISPAQDRWVYAQYVTISPVRK